MKAFDTFVAYKFIKLLSTPFEETDAFKLGIIDKDGNILKKRKDLINSKDKAAYPSNVYTLIWNLKKILSKVPIVKTRIGNFMAALYLLKEELGVGEDVLLEALSNAAKINKKDLLVERKAHEMNDRFQIKLTSHLPMSNIRRLCEARGDQTLTWDSLPKDEKFDIAELIYPEKDAEKISRLKWSAIDRGTKAKLKKALEDDTDGNVTLSEAIKVGDKVHLGHATKGGTGVTGKVVKIDGNNVHIENEDGDTFKGPISRATIKEARYGEAELDWDKMPEDEKYDVAELAFDERKAAKISKMKWSAVDRATKMKLIQTMQDETDGLITIKEGKESARDHWRRINSKGVVPAIDRNRYPNREREGLEGPYRTKKGLVYYYDKKEGKYYNPDTDMYLDVSDVMESKWGMGVSGMPLKSFPGTYRFSNPNLASKFAQYIKTNFGMDTVVAKKDGKLVHVEYQTDDPRIEKEVRKRVAKTAREIDYEVDAVMESNKWTLSDFTNISEVAPPGWEGTVKAMKDSGEVDNPWALAWWMKNQGYKSHKKKSGAQKEELGSTTSGVSGLTPDTVGRRVPRKKD